MCMFDELLFAGPLCLTPSSFDSLMPVTTGSYGYGSYGSIAGPAADSYGAVTSYARPYYASTEKREIKVKPNSCAQASSCPVCQDYINLDVIGDFCHFDGVYTIKTESSSTEQEENESCIKAKIEDVLKGNKRHEKKNIRASIRNGCSCPQLKSNDEVIVLTLRSKNISQGNLLADGEVYILPKTEAIVADIEGLKEDCANKPERFF